MTFNIILRHGVDERACAECKACGEEMKDYVLSTVTKRNFQKICKRKKMKVVMRTLTPYNKVKCTNE